MAPRLTPALILLCAVLAGCASAVPERPSVAEERLSPSEFDPGAFVPQGSKSVRIVRGDLNGDGRDDAVVVTMPDSTDPEARFARRTLSIVIAGPNGTFDVASKNTSLAGCEVCGGAMGDGLAEITIGGGALTVVNEGGIRARWSDAYTFKRDAAIGDWVLVAYSSRVSSQVDQRSESFDSTTADFGVRRFAELRQDDLPRATLP